MGPLNRPFHNIKHFWKDNFFFFAKIVLEQHLLWCPRNNTNTVISDHVYKNLVLFKSLTMQHLLNSTDYCHKWYLQVYKILCWVSCCENLGDLTDNNIMLTILKILNRKLCRHFKKFSGKEKQFANRNDAPHLCSSLVSVLQLLLAQRLQIFSLNLLRLRPQSRN